jgi:hypothetical protein
MNATLSPIPKSSPHTPHPNPCGGAWGGVGNVVPGFRNLKEGCINKTAPFQRGLLMQAYG